MTVGSRLAGVELGGTKTLLVLADGHQIIARRRLDTTTPELTLGAANAQLRDWQAEAPLDAIGIAAFGPVGLRRDLSDFGHILRTPKPGWAGADVAGELTRGLLCPWAIDTDVNGAALAEYRWGAGKGLDSLCYVTIGTGVGGGLLIGGRPVHGALHPEIGHLRVRRLTGDLFEGVCPFHGDCIEGLVSGPALARRFGVPAEQVNDEDPRWRDVASDLGELVAAVFLMAAVETVLLGGSVAMRRDSLLPKVRDAALERLNGYLPFLTAENVTARVRLAGLGDDAGPLGAIALALDAAGLHKS